MPTNPHTRRSPSLVLYGIVFRLVRSVAFHSNGQGCTHAPRQQESRRVAVRKGRVPLSLNVDAGR